MLFKASITGDFSNAIKERVSQWETQSPFSFTIVVPDGMEWWAYQEFGVSHSYTITGTNGVAFQGTAGLTILPFVTHPGLEPTHTVGTVASSLENGDLKTEIVFAFSEGQFIPNDVKQQLLQYMEKIKQAIVEQMADDLPGTRPSNAEFPLQSGKLHGQTASEVFADNATIEEF